MKKLIIILLLISCCRTEDFCWECEYALYDKMNTSTPIIKLDTFEMCYKTEEWIRKYEKTYTYVGYDDSSNLQCYKKDSI